MRFPLIVTMFMFSISLSLFLCLYNLFVDVHLSTSIDLQSYHDRDRDLAASSSSTRHDLKRAHSQLDEMGPRGGGGYSDYGSGAFCSAAKKNARILFRLSHPLIFCGRNRV